MDQEEVLTAERAKAGATYLDTHHPGWAGQITRPVNQASTRNCVIAQILGRFQPGTKALNLDEQQTVFLGFRASTTELGNDLSVYDRYYKALTASWVHEIQSRLTT